MIKNSGKAELLHELLETLNPVVFGADLMPQITAEIDPTSPTY
jgi:hypothetical protein